jgi:hypothetical protein
VSNTCGWSRRRAEQVSNSCNRSRRRIVIGADVELGGIDHVVVKLTVYMNIRAVTIVYSQKDDEQESERCPRTASGNGR